MRAGPDIARVAALVGDPARANILTALMSGLSLTARELAREAGVQPSTASSHLDALRAAGLIERQKQGRHAYYRLAGEEIAHLVETLAVVSAGNGLRRTRAGPKEPALRKARACYNHLAGAMGVHAYDSMCARDFLVLQGGEIMLTKTGRSFAVDLGLDVTATGRPLCRPCLDWSERRHHLAGTLGASLLAYLLRERWARRDSDSRIIQFSADGEQRFFEAFPIEQSAACRTGI